MKNTNEINTNTENTINELNSSFDLKNAINEVTAIIPAYKVDKETVHTEIRVSYDNYGFVKLTVDSKTYVITIKNAQRLGNLT